MCNFFYKALIIKVLNCGRSFSFEDFENLNIATAIVVADNKNLLIMSFLINNITYRLKSVSSEVLSFNFSVI